jgi:hypothetical protein
VPVQCVAESCAFVKLFSRLIRSAVNNPQNGDMRPSLEFLFFIARWPDEAVQQRRRIEGTAMCQNILLSDGDAQASPSSPRVLRRCDTLSAHRCMPIMAFRKFFDCRFEIRRIWKSVRVQSDPCRVAKGGQIDLHRNSLDHVATSYQFSHNSHMYAAR